MTINHEKLWRSLVRIAVAFGGGIGVTLMVRAILPAAWHPKEGLSPVVVLMAGALFVEVFWALPEVMFLYVRDVILRPSNMSASRRPYNDRNHADNK